MPDNVMSAMGRTPQPAFLHGARQGTLDRMIIPVVVACISERPKALAQGHSPARKVTPVTRKATLSPHKVTPFRRKVTLPAPR